MTAFAPEFLTQKRSPAIPAAYNVPLVAPYKTVLPIITFSFVFNFEDCFGLIIIFPPERPLPT